MPKIKMTVEGVIAAEQVQEEHFEPELDDLYADLQELGYVEEPHSCSVAKQLIV